MDDIDLCKDCPDIDEAVEKVELRVPVEEQNVVSSPRRWIVDEQGNRLPIPEGYVPLSWYAVAKVEKFRDGETEPYETIISEPNLVTNDGMDYLLDRMIGAGAATIFNNANARLCVGTGTATPLAADTDLSGASKLRKAMDATFPSRAGHIVTFKTTFATTDANFAWNEWGISNSAAGTILLNHSVQSFGTKTSSDTWTLTVTATMAG